MITRYRTLFSLKVAHGWCDGACDDVGFVVPEDVASRMQVAGLVARSVDGGLSVFHRADVDELAPPAAPVRAAAGETVRIGLAARSPSFANITEGFDPRAGLLVYTNRHATLDDPPRRMPLGGRALAVPLARASRPVTVTVKDAAGRAAKPETVTAADDRKVVSFDLVGVAPGVLSLTEDYPGERVETSYYMDPELARAGVFAVVEIVVDPAFYDAPSSFTVTFQARRETLRYYVVARGFSEADIGQLDVKDQGFVAAGRPEVKFTRVPSDKQTGAERSQAQLLAGDGASVLLFRSAAAVTRRRDGRKRIQLLRNNEAIVEHLPQPGRDRPTADLIVHLSKSKA